jgi:hypothetical protein
VNPEEWQGRVHYDFVTTAPCPEDRGRGRFIIDAGFQEVFGCETKADCSVSPSGAIRRSFDRRRSHAGDEGGSCAKPRRYADCVEHVCVVPSDRGCSPGLFADAGPLELEPKDLDAVLGLPGTAHPAEERLFVMPGERVVGSAVPDADGYWTPSFDEVKEVESRLRDALASFACDWRAPAIAPRLAAYQAQFLGVIEHGHRRILANYFCTRVLKMYEDSFKTRFHLGARWNTDFEDGGECFFHFWYDPSDKSIHALSINGEG